MMEARLSRDAWSMTVSAQGHSTSHARILGTTARSERTMAPPGTLDGTLVSGLPSGPGLSGTGQREGLKGC